ncbi:MAG: mechanosensitive ion channel family protein [Acidobacteria bacterium]|jgi:small-conductance mechanosensitive channel|nr:mechanosensitive ion channel family protein [Acidobacteriota bacterium]MBK9527215.1 mechanosensitive ion channel family protein [Acidobacteriota bacterium]MBP7475279.1 mechanosensitive ion channel family protein [Pyrinomonadaceae bacterium]MBP9108202.1 mechanosensitive ion channel family protein [Pyrinomonadaceae bacterium]
MTASEIKKKAFFFVIFAAICIAALLLFPAIEAWIRSALAARLGMEIDNAWKVLAGDTESDRMMTVTVSSVGTLLKVARVIIAMALVVATVRFVTLLLTKALYRNSEAGEISSLLKTVLSVIIYIVAFFTIFQSQFPGIELTALFTGSTIIGIVVGLALQDTLGNLFAGLALQADQPFQVGDVVLLPGRGEGVVEAVSWRGVKIRTFSNKLLVVSNSVLGKELIEVAPKDNLNAKSVFFNTLYTNSPARTIQVVREAVRQVENVSPKMRPVVRIRNLAADGLDWEVKYWLEDYRLQHDTDALIRQRIWYTFQREKIHFAFPTRTLYMEPKPEELPAEEVFNTISDRLNNVSIFAPLSEEEIERLANASVSRVYAPGEAVVRAGQEGNSMYVVIRGSVKVQVRENDLERTINTLRENEFFGEMSLLTGEPRTATVIANEESEVLRIDKSGLKPIFEGNPQLVESVSELIDERRQILTQVGTDTGDNANDVKKKGVMGSIRKFFGIR